MVYTSVGTSLYDELFVYNYVSLVKQRVVCIPRAKHIAWPIVDFQDLCADLTYA